MDILHTELHKIPLCFDDYDYNCKPMFGVLCDRPFDIEKDIFYLHNFVGCTKNDSFSDYSTGERHDLLPELLDGGAMLSDTAGEFDTIGTRPADSIFTEFDQRDEFQLVSPNSILPVTSALPVSSLCLDFPELSEETNELPAQIIKEDKWLQSNEKVILHHDHCYSAQPLSLPPSPSGSFESAYVSSPCSDNSSCSEVDVETIPQPPVPKIKITVTSVTPVAPVTQRKRGRKPSKKKQLVKKPKIENFESGVSPKCLRQALHSNKKNYVTKSGRVTQNQHSVETSPSSSASSSQHSSRCNSDCEETVDKRASHNMAERNRRQELTNLFQQLRRKVTEIKNNPKASKVSILQSSTNFISELEPVGKKYELLRDELKAQLENRVALLQSLIDKCTEEVEQYSS